jgi:CheY-like chemotaxis protein
VLTAEHGLKALNIVRKVCQEDQCPHLILLVVNMLLMDGFEFLEEIQKSADLSKTALKIVLFSSSQHQLDLARAQKYPVIDFVEKAITLEKITKYL